MTGFTKWLIYDIPVVLAILLVMFVLLRLNRLFFRRLNNLLISRARRSHDEESLEAEKRINTLSGILKGLGRILIWSVFP
jgi:moderate conductance mechanosensitive channel